MVAQPRFTPARRVSPERVNRCNKKRRKKRRIQKATLGVVLALVGCSSTPKPLTHAQGRPRAHGHSGFLSDRLKGKISFDRNLKLCKLNFSW